jgi:hypothetical protein
VETPDSLGIIAGSGAYPILLAQSARRSGVGKIVAAAFTGETDAALANSVDAIEWMRVGQLSRLIKFLTAAGVHHAIMAGQIAPKNLFDLRPDIKTVVMLARLKQRNAESIFSAIAEQLSAAGVELLPATTFLDEFVASPGLIAGPALTRRQEEDVSFGFHIAKEMSRLDVGQTIVVRSGTVLAVEAFEGTNEAIKRGGALGRKDAVVVKVSKPNQDLRFDVPVIGAETVRIAARANIRVIAVEAGRTLLLEKQDLIAAGASAGVSIVAR